MSIGASEKRTVHKKVYTAFRRTVRTYFRKHGRTLPWRDTTDPYAIAVSEVMLQQTQVPRVIEKFQEFMRRFPTVQSLAASPLGAVLAIWSGLGYNRRAKYLHEMAKVVCAKHGGTFPKSAEALESLPGIGHYTAGAIRAFAYNEPAAFIETNIRTVYIHHFFPDAKTVSDRELMDVVEATVDKRNPRQWYAALMDYGTYLKQSGSRIHRKSTQYTRQSSFAGSRRELRGMIVKSLLQGKKTLHTIVLVTGKPESAVAAAIADLIRENMVEKKGSTYALAST